MLIPALSKGRSAANAFCGSLDFLLIKCESGFLCQFTEEFVAFNSSFCARTLHSIHAALYSKRGGV